MATVLGESVSWKIEIAVLRYRFFRYYNGGMNERLRSINYNHLYYFWRVAQLSSVSQASVELGLAQSTVSAQLKALEAELGEQLYERRGRTIALTQSGTLVLRYCTQIFDLGSELLQLLEGEVQGKPERLRLGVADTLPKMLVYKLLQPVLSSRNSPHLTVGADNSERLLADLSIHLLDAVISDCPIPPSVNVRAYNHLLGESGVSFLIRSSLMGQRRMNFHERLNTSPLLLPTRAAAIRAHLDSWFTRHGIAPLIAAEFQDSALMKLFGMHGRGIFPVPTIVEREVCKEYHCSVVGRIEEPIEKIYLIMTERRVRSPSLARIGL